MHPGARVGAVGEHEEVEVLEGAGALRASDGSPSSPAKTRSTGSSQIGITIAVRVPGSIGASGSTLASIEKRSRRRSSSSKPSTAVQKPIEIHAKSAPKKIAMASSRGVSPLWGSTLVMNGEATTARRDDEQREQQPAPARDADPGHAAAPLPGRGPRGAGLRACAARGGLARVMRRRRPRALDAVRDEVGALERRHRADPLGARERGPLGASLRG